MGAQESRKLSFSSAIFKYFGLINKYVLIICNISTAGRQVKI